MTTAQFGSYISADSHVTEPPEAYAQIDAAFRDRAPRLEHLPGMGATIVIDPGGEGEAFVPFGRIAAAGRTHIDRPDGWRWDELHRGGYDAVARISEQTADGFAAVPTIVKSYRHPESENRWLYLASAINAGVTLLTVREWTFAFYGFPAYILAVTIIIFALVARPRAEERIRRALGDPQEPALRVR